MKNCFAKVVAITFAAIMLGALLAGVNLGAAESGAPSKYNGPGSCSSPSCHGGVQARDQTTVLQNEYSTWVVRDKHAHAYVNLTNPVGVRIAKIMGLPSPDTAPRCLACHALDVPPDERARTFDLTDGVGCENCHGPASAWLGPHTTRGWNYAKSQELGMYDTRDLVKRSERCLTCHLGTPEKSVDHELIAAGHPDLYFELDSFMSVMPPHWKEVDTDPWFAVRAMAVGQAVQMREQLKRVARESQSGIWPEYGELDCFACHHSNRLQVASEAASVSELAGRLATRLNAMKFDQAQTLRLMKSISGDADAIAEQGERPAEQATMALDSLFIAYSKNGKLANDTQIRAAINGLFRQVDNPSDYDGFKFAAAMKSLNGLIE
jgi:hypothetical protein